MRLWWCLLSAVAACFVTRAQAFSPQVYGPIQWMKFPTRRFALCPRGFPDTIKDIAPHQKLAIKDLTDSPHDVIPSFVAQPDNTITWDGVWCIEAGGDEKFHDVRLNHCTGAPAQKWNWVPDSHGRNMIQLQGSTLCLDASEEGFLSGGNVRLEECGRKATASWQFADVTPLPADSQRHTLLSGVRHVSLLVIALVGVGALSLGAWTRRWHTKARTIAAGQGGVPMTVHQAGAGSSTQSRAGLAQMMAQSGTRGKLRARITGIGSCGPERCVTNDELSKIVETDDAWISKRTGISARRVLQPNESLTGLATTSAQRALENAGVSAEDVDLVIVATSSPDDLFGDAAYIAREIGAVDAVGFDLTAACSGFLFAVTTASQYLHSGAYKTALVVGADSLSRWVDWSDRNTCVLFGDGAGAVVMKAAESDAEAGVLGYGMHSNGAGRADLNCSYAGEEQVLPDVTSITNGKYSPIKMNGKEVFKFATTRVPEVLDEALQNAGVTADQLDWIVLHQANIRIIEGVAKKFGLPMDKVITNLSDVGNTSAGSIPLALDEAVREGKVKKGDLIAMSGFGAGLSWGAAIIRWG